MNNLKNHNLLYMYTGFIFNGKGEIYRKTCVCKNCNITYYTFDKDNFVELYFDDLSCPDFLAKSLSCEEMQIKAILE